MTHADSEYGDVQFGGENVAKNTGRGLAFLSGLASLLRRIRAGANAGSSGNAASPPTTNAAGGHLLAAFEQLVGGAAAAMSKKGEAQTMETAGESGLLSELDRLLETLAGAEQGGAEAADARPEPPASGEASGSSGALARSPSQAAGPILASPAGAAMSGDAIDQVLAEAPRSTRVVSLRESPEVVAFRNELTDGLIRVDTANQLLRLINEVVVRVLR